MGPLQQNTIGESMWIVNATNMIVLRLRINTLFQLSKKLVYCV